VPADEEAAGLASTPREHTEAREAQRASASVASSDQESRGGPEVRGTLPGDPDVAASNPGDRGVGVYPPGKKWRAAFFVLASVGILTGIAWALLGDRLLVVRVITVSGTRLVTPAQVREKARVPAGTPLIRVDTAQVAARVETIRQVASARVSKDWPDGLSITVTERVPVVAVRMAGGGYDLVDHDGVIVTYQRAKPTALPLFQTALPAGQMHGNPDVATASAVLAELPPWLHREVAKVAVTSANSSVGGAASGSGDAENATVPAGSVVLYIDRDQTVVWGSPDMAGMTATELAILMRDRASYYDVSDPKTAVTR
jgi:cell division protein FtsQ